MASLLVGLWLIVAPAILGYEGSGQTNDRIVGPIVAAIATVALAQVMRGLRWLNVLAALWLAAAPSALGYVGVAAANSATTAAVLLAVAPHGGAVARRFGGGWRSLLRPGGR